MKTWLKGGLIGIILGIIICLVFFILAGNPVNFIFITVSLIVNTLLFSLTGIIINKTSKYWLKGGVIGLSVIVFIFSTNLFVDLIIAKRGIFGGEFSMLLFLLAFPPSIAIMRYLDNIPNISGINITLIVIFLEFVSYFILGSIIGLIVGKIKGNREEKREEVWR